MIPAGPLRLDLPPEARRFSFECGPDPGREGRLLVRVLLDGAPFSDLRGEPYAKVFPASARPGRVEAFCLRFATDDAFRASVLVKDAFACC